MSAADHYRRSDERSITMNNRFDAWTKELGAQRDRRGVLTLAAGGVLGLLGLAGFASGASAKQCNKNNDCPNNKPKCKGGTCVECQNNGDCPNGKKCNNQNNCVKK